MDTNVILELYKAQLRSKDAFTDRFFVLNRYYLTIVLVLAVLGMYFVVDKNFMVSAIIAVTGCIVSILWWLNQDAYNIQIKVKYVEILEKLEENLPFKPLKTEYEAIQRNKQKMFIFPDTLKLFSVLVFFIFLVMFVNAFVPFIYKFFAM